MLHDTTTMPGTVAMLTRLSPSSPKGGTFINPDTGQGVTGEALANYAKGLWAAFPDFSIELVNAGEIGAGLVAHHWLLRGTNTGPLADGSPPTGRALTLRGASIIQVEGDKIRSDQCYFDRQIVYEQLGLNVTKD